MNIKQIHYGKNNVSVYRACVRPLILEATIPESLFKERNNSLFAIDVNVKVFGDNFKEAYTLGDNSKVVATDTMKNFILEKAHSYNGSTHEGFLYYLGCELLSTYPQMQRVILSGTALSYEPAKIVSEDSNYVESTKLFTYTIGESPQSEVEIIRNENGYEIKSHSCSRTGFKLIKTTGSSFAGFVKDSYTTLPERIDRPLYIHFDVSWRYTDPTGPFSIEANNYVDSQQIKDIVYHTFESFVSMSIQHLVHEFGKKILERFPQISEVSFAAQNRLWDTAIDKGPKYTDKVYCDPRPPYGLIGLVVTREDL